MIERRPSRQIMVGNVPVGGDAPITVQTMTNTPTEDVGATIDQIRRCEDAGADIIRVSCPTAEATEHFDRITKAANVPIVADIHFHYKRALEAADKGAACLRINPGNIGSSQRVAEVVRAAKANGCAIRIGVNAGSLEKDLLEKYGEPCPEALIESALDHIKLLQDHDFHEFKVAVKASDVFLAVAAYHGLAEAVDCPLHLGITEAGGLVGGTVKSSIGMGSLLWAGIGDTIRVSLSAEPEQEVRVGYEMLKADFCLPSLDRGFHALMEDLSGSGQLDETLVAMFGEFGRTPKINKKTGRDHWGAVQSTVLAGGGIEGGQVYGTTDRDSAYPTSKPVSPEDMLATMHHALGIAPESEIVDSLGRPHRIVNGRPLVELFSA